MPSSAQNVKAPAIPVLQDATTQQSQTITAGTFHASEGIVVTGDDHDIAGYRHVSTTTLVFIRSAQKA